MASTVRNPAEFSPFRVLGCPTSLSVAVTVLKHFDRIRLERGLVSLFHIREDLDFSFGLENSSPSCGFSVVFSVPSCKWVASRPYVGTGRDFFLSHPFRFIIQTPFHRLLSISCSWMRTVEYPINHLNTRTQERSQSWGLELQALKFPLRRCKETFCLRHLAPLCSLNRFQQRLAATGRMGSRRRDEENDHETRMLCCLCVLGHSTAGA
jgi:hypothetical protein